MAGTAATRKAEILTDLVVSGFHVERDRAVARRRASMADSGQAHFVMTDFAFKLGSKLGECREKRHGRLNDKIALGIASALIPAGLVMNVTAGICKTAAHAFFLRLSFVRCLRVA